MGQAVKTSNRHNTIICVVCRQTHGVDAPNPYAYNDLMRIVPSPWRAEFNALLSSAKKEVRITAPFYGEDAIAGILNRAGKTVAKYFLLALSEQAVVARSQSTAAIALIRKDGSSSLRFIKNLHAKFIIVDKTTAIVTSSNLTRAGLESNVEMGIRVDDPKTVAELIRQFDGLWSKASVVVIC